MNIKRALLSSLLSASILLSGCSKSDPAAESAAAAQAEEEAKQAEFEAEEARISAMTSLEVVKDMKNGTNLGNTMEAVITVPVDTEYKVYNFETGWGAPITTQEMVDGLKAAGFDTLRIPVAWSNMISDDGNYTIDPQYFTRVDEIINYAFNNDMYAIVNIHWDGDWWTGLGDADEAVRNETMKRFKAMWTQIAEHYKDWSYKLILESANEELGDSFKTALGLSGAYDKVNEVNQEFVTLVRSTGGKNADRFLLLAGFNTDIDKTVNAKYLVPQDSAENKLIVSVHYYTPSTYCIANNKYNSWGYREDWGTDEDKEEMRTYFSKLQRFTDEGVGVIIGEYGVCTIKQNYVTVLKPGAADFYASVLALSEEMGYCPVLWDIGEVYNRNTCQMNYEDVAKVFTDAKASES